jgi:hypothetical protein
MTAKTLSDGLSIDREEIERILKDIGLDVQIRPERIALEDWIKITHLLTK